MNGTKTRAQVFLRGMNTHKKLTFLYASSNSFKDADCNSPTFFLISSGSAESLLASNSFTVEI